MSENIGYPKDPRWGQEARDRKALAILKTLELHCGKGFRDGVWLDLGCGSGGIASTLAAKVNKVVGIDPEPWARWSEYMLVQQNLEFLRMTCADMLSSGGIDQFDVVVCNQVYEHTGNPIELLNAIYCALKPDGVCYFAGPNLLWPIEPHVFWPLVHWFPRRFSIWLMRLFHSKRLHLFDAHSWSYWKLTRAFTSNGFVYQNAIPARIEIELDNRKTPLKKAFSIIPRRLLNALTPVAPGFVFVLSKGGCR